MKTTHQFRPSVERLDKRELPSATSVFAWPGGGAWGALGTPGVEHVHQQPHQQMALRGTVTGTWTSVPTNPDTGMTQQLDGAGQVKPLGAVIATGTLHMPGFIREGRTTGTMVLTNAQGSVTLQLTGPPQPGFSPPPNTFTYKIVSGTGAYAGATGHGMATFSETMAGTFSMTFKP
jgi:hypothetical protein